MEAVHQRNSMQAKEPAEPAVISGDGTVGADAAIQVRNTNTAANKVKTPTKLMPELKQLSVDKLVRDFNEKERRSPENDFDQMQTGADGLTYGSDQELASRTRRNFRRRDSKNETRGAGFSVSRGRDMIQLQ